MTPPDPFIGLDPNPALPCPFCGNLPHLRQRQYMHGPETVRTFTFVCPNRMCIARVGFIMASYSMQDALQIWNNQPATQKLIRLELLAHECASMRHADYKTAEATWKKLEDELHNNPVGLYP